MYKENDMGLFKAILCFQISSKRPNLYNRYVNIIIYYRDQVLDLCSSWNINIVNQKEGGGGVEV